jgi:hypothetical protein
MQLKTKLVTVLKQWCTLLVNTNQHEDLNLIFTNHRKEDVIYCLTTIEIVKAQKKDHQIYYKKMQKHQNLIGVFNLLKT